MSKRTLWISRILQGLVVAFLAADGVAKLIKPQMVVDGTVELGWPESSIVPLGVILLISVVLYAVPRTAVLGAILLTGYLGGAIATHFRLGQPLFANTLFPVYFGVIVWGALWLRDERLRALVPLRPE